MNLVAQRLLALFVAGWLLLSFPLLGLWNHDLSVWGLPLFPLALFVIWGGLIAALAWVVERPDPDDEDLDASPGAGDAH
jgi:hypothetical protein